MTNQASHAVPPFLISPQQASRSLRQTFRVGIPGRRFSTSQIMTLYLTHERVYCIKFPIFSLDW